MHMVIFGSVVVVHEKLKPSALSCQQIFAVSRKREAIATDPKH